MNSNYRPLLSMRTFLDKHYRERIGSVYSNVAVKMKEDDFDQALYLSCSENAEIIDYGRFSFDVSYRFYVSGQTKFERKSKIVVDLENIAVLYYEDFVNQLERDLKSDSTGRTVYQAILAGIKRKVHILQDSIGMSALYDSENQTYAKSIINRFINLNADQISEYLKIDEKIDEMLPITYLREIITSRHGDELKHSINTELKHYHSTDHDDSKMQYIYNEIVESICSEIILGTYKVSNIIKSRKHKIVYDMLSVEGSPVNKMRYSELVNTAKLILDDAPAIEVVKQLNLDIDSTHYINNLFNDNSFTSRFDDFYYDFMDNRFYQKLLVMIRENGYRR